MGHNYTRTSICVQHFENKINLFPLPFYVPDLQYNSIIFFITEALIIWSLLIEIFIALWSADNDYDILYFTVSNTS